MDNELKEILTEVSKRVKNIINEEAYAALDDYTKKRVYDITMSKVKDKLISEKFNEYYNQWRFETCIIASENERYSNKNFQAIVAMGKSALPYIGKKLLEGEYSIVLACGAIYGYALGKPTYSFKEASERWIKKLKQDGYLTYDN